MKILTASQIRGVDAATIAEEQITSLELMERAAANCTNWIKTHYSNKHNFIILAGKGNNGGDGLAIARQLCELNYSVAVFCAEEGLSIDCEANKRRLPKSIISIELRLTEIKKSSINENTIFIDALFGSGLSREIEGEVQRIIKYVNHLENDVISVDVPSGLFASGLSRSATIIADHTLTLEFPKQSLLLPENGIFTGEMDVIPIGLSQQAIESHITEMYFVNNNDVKGLLKPRTQFAHKGDFGHAMLCVGSYGMMGAAILSSKACLRSGVGKLTSYIPKCGYAALQVAVPEAMALASDSETELTSLPSLNSSYVCIGFGCGVGKSERVSGLLKVLIQQGQNLVIDADGLNILSENKTWLSFLPAETILTPHVGEFDRLFGKSNNSEERISLLKESAKKHSIYIVLKGKYTVTAFPDGTLYFNSTGNPGMATAGSGDVLLGIITGLVAQGLPKTIATIYGVYIHGAAGDLAANKRGEQALIAGDIIERLGDAFLENI